MSDNSEIYGTLISIRQGNDMVSQDVEGGKGITVRINVNHVAPNNSKVELVFDETKDYWKLFEDVTTDDIWLANSIYSQYSTFELINDDYVIEDWNEGYLIPKFDLENLNTLKDILKLIAPNYVKHDSINYKKTSELLSKLFSRHVDDIISSYAVELNNCMINGIKTTIKDETCNPFRVYGIFSSVGCFYKYKTSLGVLLFLYEKYGDPSMDISELLRKLSSDLYVGGWSESMYDHGCDDFDDVTFNNDVSRELEKIMDKITESEDFLDIQQSAEKVSEIINKYDLDVWYELPKDPNKIFKIKDINIKKGVLVVLVKDGEDTTQKRSYRLDDFNLFLHTPELF